ncbi:hypothetical protein EG68_07040 [Paragonimus skrjabini miyazakii]|uniref:Uncharacterized protein n=1 Tax=Paragonimus skrjabini miyazakii TaxID=59628 RepID=A0A8S9YWW8_9TREM|nr:hypothetical protein EG68_07040 [Paragonimus skrjabini miyazakii]
MLKDLYVAISLRLGNRSDESIKKRLQLLRWERPTAASALQPTAANQQVPEFTRPRDETHDNATTDDLTAPLPPIIETSPSFHSTRREEEQDDKPPTIGTTSGRSTPTVYSPKGSDWSVDSSVGLDWRSPVISPGSSNATAISQEVFDRKHASSPNTAQSVATVESLTIVQTARLPPILSHSPSCNPAHTSSPSKSSIPSPCSESVLN